MAVGVDLRGERFETEGENFLSGIAPRIVAPLVYERDVSAAFVEFRAPFVSAANARPGLERLEFSLAARIEDHEGVGQSTNPKVGLLYSPASDLLLRASHGTSFRAPALRELFTAYALGPMRNGVDVRIVEDDEQLRRQRQQHDRAAAASPERQPARPGVLQVPAIGEDRRIVGGHERRRGPVPDERHLQIVHDLHRARIEQHRRLNGLEHRRLRVERLRVLIEPL